MSRSTATKTAATKPIEHGHSLAAEPPHFQHRKITPIMPTLYLGDQGEAVRTLQKRLGLCVVTSCADGVFGPLTRRSVRTFQYRMFLPVDGIVGPKTWDALMLGMPIGLPLLHVGSWGEQVYWVQEILANLGLYTASLDRTFRLELEVAVRRYQASRGLAHVDGIVGEQTWAALSRDRLSVTHWEYV